MSDSDAPLVIAGRDGFTAAIHPYGARIASLRVPARDGPIETVLGHATPCPPADDTNYLGNVVGRVSGRIARSRFALDGVTYVLQPNEGRNHLHGGRGGFHVRRWTVVAHDPGGAEPLLVLALRSDAGDGGYPGALDVTATFRIANDGLSVELVAQADVATPVALTLHPYFNLSGDHSREIGDHWLALSADAYLELDAEFLPTGVVTRVEGTPFDFREPRRVGEVAADARELRPTAGYDHTWVCQPDADWQAHLEHRGSGLSMRVASNQPGIQFYAGQYLRASPGVAWRQRCGLCLEPQLWPDAVNQAGFPTPILRPGQTYRNRIEYRFAQAR